MTGVGRYHPLGRTAAHAHMGFLHTHGDRVSIGSTVESVLNVLYHGDSYLLAVVPDRDPDVDDQRSRYVRVWRYLFADEDSVSDLLAWPSGSPGLRLIAFSFNEPTDDKEVEAKIMRESVFEEDSLIRLPDHGGFTNDLIVMAAHYLLVYAILDRRWERDRRLRQATMKGPVDRRI